MAISLLEWVDHLLRDPEARHAFEEHPNRYAHEHGFQDLSHADVHDVLNLIIDSRDNYGHDHYPLPRHWDHGHTDSGADYLRGYFTDNRDFFRGSDDGRDRWNDDRNDRNDHDRNDHDRDRWDGDRDDHGRHDHDRGDHDLRLTGHDTNIDNSVHQRVDTGDHDRDRWDGDRDDHGRWDGDRWDGDRGDDWGHRGGDFNQSIDNDPVVASGDHSVATGGDVRDSVLTSGRGNVVGDHNHATTGHDNTTAFGSGDATHARLAGMHTGDGSSVSVGGDAAGHSEDNDTRTSAHNSGSGSTSVNAAGDHGDSQQYADQHDSDHSTHSNYDDDSYSRESNMANSHNDDRFEDSHNTDVHH
ncbi:MAG TPA: hypothetical protein VFE65_30680 [Pseudonocardia sp.]|jgi:hypothetical protein|nr:hypothetical protein [Pseudonocardia sp.]